VTTQVCDQCGHVTAHLDPPTVLVPYQPKGTTARVVLSTTECERATLPLQLLRAAGSAAI
jgi:hypothetical protein